MSADRWTRPLGGSDMLALFTIWLAVFCVVIASVRLFDW